MFSQEGKRGVCVTFSIACINNKDEKTKHRCYRRILFDEINHKIDLVKRFKNKTTVAEGNLLYLKYHAKREERKSVHASNRSFKTYSRKSRRRMEYLQPNPNKLVINPTALELTNKQYSALQFGLKHGIATRPQE